MDLTTYTELTKNIGTFVFMTPEIFDESTQYNEKVDVYSFGVVMYYIVTKGEMPLFRKDKSYESLKFPKTLNSVSKNIIKQCWSNNPDRRPSFEDILNKIIKSNFLLIDRIQSQILELKEHLDLD